MPNKIFIYCALVLSTVFTGVQAHARGDNLPDGYSAYLTYIANGSFAIADPHPVVPGCVGGFCDGDYFQSVIMKREQATVDILETQAQMHFKNKFGIDVNAPENAGRILFRTMMVDPRIEYRAYHVSGTKAPEEGWVVRDGGWLMMVLDPDGYILGGEFAGLTVPAGSMFFYGEYNIAVTKSHDNDDDDDEHKPHDEYDNNKLKEEIVISYRSGSPVFPNALGFVAFACELALRPLTENFPNGTEGLAQGFGGPMVPDANGMVTANTRNSLTFSDNGGI